MTWVKICGTTNLEDALTAIDAGTEALGFVFYEKSPRKIDVEAAREIVSQLPGNVEKVGVFVNELPERVARTADEVGLTAVQLHGDEHGNSSSQVSNGPRKLFVAIPVSLLSQAGKGNKSAGLTWFSARPEACSAIFLDSGSPEQRGGTGKRFDWEDARPWVSQLSQKFRIVVAGGLTPTNVADAMRLLHPWGVDVASGVELKPGKKDPEKVRAFVQAVRRAEKSI